MEALPFSHIADGIAIPCVRCNEYVEVRALQHHRQMHRVWRILHCTSDTAPKTMKQLLRKRRQIINSAMMRLEPGVPLPARVLQRIDWAFEVIRNTFCDSDRPFTNGICSVNNLAPLSYIESSSRNTSPQRKAMDYMVDGKSETLNYCGQSVGVCQHSNSKWRTTNEDRYFYTESSLGDLDFGFFGLFDGHNGQTAAEKCSEKFYGFLRDELILCADNASEESTEGHLGNREDLVKQAIRNSFSKMDSYLLTGESEPSKVRWSGTSATVCYIERDTLYTANSGRVRALFVRKDGSAVGLLEDHTLDNRRERDRIRKATGATSLNSGTTHVDGLFSSTRGLGNHGDPALKAVVIPDPSIKVSKIDPSDQFLVMFTAGISDIFSDEEVMFLLEDIMPETSEIESLREHFVHKDQNEQEHQSLKISRNNQVLVDENETSLCGSDLAIHSTKGNENTAFQMMPSLPTTDLAIGAKSTSMSFDNIAFEVNTLNCKGRMSLESKPCFLARALVERLVHSAVLADTRENTSAMVILLHGCPINLYLLPNVKRKSLFLREVQISENDRKHRNKGEITADKHCNE